MNLQESVRPGSNRLKCSLPVVAFVAILALAPKISQAADLDWTIAPYLWASDVGLDLTVNSDPVIGTNVPFSDLVDKLDSAFMGRIEMNSERFGMMFDSIYIKLTDSSVTAVGPGGPILGDLLINTSLTLTIYEFAGFYRMGKYDSGSSAFDILLGGRQVDSDLSLNIVLPGPGATPINAGIDISETDVIVGARFVGKFNDRWSYRVRADYGSGGTEGAINAQAAIGYTFGQTGLFSIDLGYRYLNMELKNNSNGSLTETDITLSGPLLGLVFRF